MPVSRNDRVPAERMRGRPLCSSERLIRTMANSGDRRRREEPERTTEALFLGIIGNGDQRLSA
jgi:hypothetical protein